MSNLQQDRLYTNAYRSYLVRFWQSNEQGYWRASAQCVQTGNTVLFGEVERLLAFLEAELQPSSKSDEANVAPLPSDPS